MRGVRTDLNYIAYQIYLNYLDLVWCQYCFSLHHTYRKEAHPNLMDVLCMLQVHLHYLRTKMDMPSASHTSCVFFEKKINWLEEHEQNQIRFNMPCYLGVGKSGFCFKKTLLVLAYVERQIIKYEEQREFMFAN